MRPVSQQFLDALRAPHTMAVRADVLRERQTIIEGVPIIGGNVTLDRTADIRGRAHVTLGGRADNGSSLLPVSALDAITPFGNELQLWRGVRFSSGDELVSLGIFGIVDTNVSDDGATIEIDGLDRAQLIKDADFESTYVVAAGVNYGTAIRELIDAGVPGLQYRFAPIDAVTPLLVFADDTAGGRLTNALAMAASVGCDLYLDGDGVVVLTPVPDPRGNPVIDLHDGEGGVVVAAPKTWSRASAFNAVIAYATNPAPGVTPPRAIARDIDPTSPTYYFGPFGRKPKHSPSEFIASQDQAQTAADAELRGNLGVAQTIQLTAVPNPALEPADLASVRRRSLSIDEIDVVDTVDIPLDVGGVMSLGVRARQVFQ